MKTTNYHNTFIEVAEDCPAEAGEVPPRKGGDKTVAVMQFEMLRDNPYKFTSDDILFAVHAQRNDISRSMMSDERDAFFSKGQACFRSSPLTKRYGWGVHCDADGRMALCSRNSAEYVAFLNDQKIKKVKAMRSGKK